MGADADFRREVRDALRYERRLLLNAAVALLIVAVVVVLHQLAQPGWRVGLASSP